MVDGGRFARRPDVAWVDDGERVAAIRLVDLGAPAIILTGSAAAIWRELECGGTPGEVISRVAIAYALEAEELAADVEAWLIEAEGLGLVSRL